MSDKAGIKSLDVGVYGVQPGLFNALLPDFLSVDYDQSELMTGTDLTE